MKNELFKSYRQVIERMNVSGVRPFSETEIQPIYSDIWCEKIIKLLLDKPEKIVPLNPSIIRSMLIMDLIDCNYYNLKLKEE